jgi:alpha-1,2-mannosyltransferase
MTAPTEAAPVFESRKVGICCALLLGLYAGVTAILWLKVAFLHLGDFTSLWAAGRLAAAGRAAAAYDWAAIRALQPFHASDAAFLYPPFFLAALVPFGLLPYTPAAALWLATTTAGYLASIRAILPGATAIIAALAAPPFLIDVSWGQNGLVVAALLGGGLVLLDRRPVAAGILLGAMAYKPHYGILLPLFLAVTGRWRVFAAAAATVVALVAVAVLLFGWSSWLAFADALGAVGATIAQYGRLAAAMRWQLLASLYAVLRTLGCGAAVAASAQAAVAFAAAAAALLLAAGRASDNVKFAGLATAVLVIPPYSEPSDWNILAVAVAFVVRDSLSRRLQPWEKAGLAIVYLLPLVNLVSRAILPGWYAEPIMCAVLAAIIAGRARQRRREAATGHIAAEAGSG